MTSRTSAYLRCDRRMVEFLHLFSFSTDYSRSATFDESPFLSWVVRPLAAVPLLLLLPCRHRHHHWMKIQLFLRQWPVPQTLHNESHQLLHWDESCFTTLDTTTATGVFFSSSSSCCCYGSRLNHTNLTVIIRSWTKITWFNGSRSWSLTIGYDHGRNIFNITMIVDAGGWSWMRSISSSFSHGFIRYRVWSIALGTCIMYRERSSSS